MPQCRKCQTPILFATQKVWSPTLSRYMIKTGARPSPIDARPSLDGNIVLDSGGYYIITKTQAERDRMVAEGRATNFHKSHFSSCPFAEEFCEEQRLKRQRAARDRGMEALYGPRRDG